MKVFSPDHWLFSAKLFGAAMIAYALSVRMALPQSYWAVVTCCVVMNPISGAVRAKATYRFTGTVLGGVTALLLTAAFGSVPLLLIVTAGLVGSMVFGLSVLDRTPRAYGFQLYGVTLVLVLVAGVDHPERMFDTAVARICEIGVGLFCATVVDSVVAPRSLRPFLRQRLGVWLPDMATWIEDVLQGRLSDAKTRGDRERIVGDLAALSALSGQLRYDPSISRWARQCAFAIQARLLQLMPMLSAVETHLASLPPARRALLLPRLEPALQRAREGASGVGLELGPARAAAPEGPEAWYALVEESLAGEVSDILRLWSEVRAIAAALADRRLLAGVLAARVEAAQALPLQPDFYMAWRVAGGILLTYAVLAGLWWATGWTQGANALLFGIIAVGFFGSLDEAGKAIGAFARFSAMAMIAAGILSYALLPLAGDFPTFALAVGVVMLPLGAWAATNPLAILMLAMTFSNINLQARYAPWDFGSFLDAVSALMLGICLGYFCIGMVRRMGPAHIVQRFARLERSDVAALSRRADRRALNGYSNRALDRVAGMVVRNPGPRGGDGSEWLLAWIRTGVAVGTIRWASAGLAGDLGRACEALLAQVHEDLGQGRHRSAAMLERLDRALALAGRAPRESVRSRLLRGLVELRLSLAEGSPVWEPAP